MSNARTAPIVWLLKGAKAGDYEQLRVIARALDVPALTKQLVFRRWELLLHAIPHPTLAGIDVEQSDPLEPPWPDLVLTAGRRNELVARWIQRQSGGRSRLVHVGRPWSNPARFDLVVSNRQYLLEGGGNVIVNDLPLTDLTDAALAADRETWRAKWAALVRPWIVLLVGGDTGPFVFSPAQARALAARVNAKVARAGGSLLVTTSGRTAPQSADALLDALDSPAYVYRWPSREPSPYRGLLACADEFVVTADSMSMLTEACATGRPVWLFEPLDDRPAWRNPATYRWMPFVNWLSLTVGPARMRRDLRRVHAALLESGRVQRLDSVARESSNPTRARETSEAADSNGVSRSVGADDLARTAARVRALLPR
jgi:mitochondrial fission protein ELM1